MMPHSNNIYSALDAYRTSYEMSLTPLQIIAELYRAMLNNIANAKQSYENGKYDEMCLHNDKTFRIISALRSRLDMENGKDASEFLHRFYTLIFFRLSNILGKQDIPNEYNNIHGLVRVVYERWEKLAYPKCGD